MACPLLSVATKVRNGTGHIRGVHTYMYASSRFISILVLPHAKMQGNVITIPPPFPSCCDIVVHNGNAYNCQKPQSAMMAIRKSQSR